MACKVWSEQALRLLHLAECALAIHSKCHLIRLNIHSIDHNLEKVCQDQVSRGFAPGICRFFSCSNPCFSTDKLYWNFTEKDLKFVLGSGCFLLAVTLLPKNLRNRILLNLPAVVIFACHNLKFKIEFLQVDCLLDLKLFLDI